LPYIYYSKFVIPTKVGIYQTKNRKTYTTSSAFGGGETLKLSHPNRQTKNR